VPKTQDPKAPVTLVNAELDEMSANERLKVASEGLFFVLEGETRLPFAHELDALTAGDAETLSDTAKEIAKHFGFYKQRVRDESGGKTGDYIFMVRVKNPAGGELSPEQWLALDEAADRYADGTLRLTSRQGIQFHFVYGRHLAALIRHLNANYRDRGCRISTLGACGDVSRNVMCSPIDDLDAELPLDSHALAQAIADELAPRSSAYFQIFLSDDDGRTVAPLSSEEPLYGEHYLPRKFKVGFAHPHDNSIDLLTQDVGFLPVVIEGHTAYDLYTGGGLGITHNQAATKQLLGEYLGRVPREDVVASVREIALLQRDHGERKDRRQSRWKYTLRRLGVDRVRRELHERAIRLEAAAPQMLPPCRYFHGWHRENGGAYYLGLPVESGRLRDTPHTRLRSAVRQIVDELGDFGLGLRVTPNQDLLLCHVPAAARARVEATLEAHGVPPLASLSAVRRRAFACPAKPTCGLAMTEAERLLPSYLATLEAAGLGEVDVIIRLAGCPNSCSRPPTAEVGIYGYGKNDFVIQVGGARNGSRIGKVLHERVPGERMPEVLTRLVAAIRDQNPQRLPAGEFLHQTPVDVLRGLVGLD
jgi:sulfite reductase (ferredoxin)